MTLFPQNKALPNGYARRGWSGGYHARGFQQKNGKKYKNKTDYGVSPAQQAEGLEKSSYYQLYMYILTFTIRADFMDISEFSMRSNSRTGRQPE